MKRELDEAKESLTRMTSSTKKLDKRGIGYEDSKEISTPTKTIFVKSLGKIEASPVHTPRKKIDLGQCSRSAQVKEAPKRQPQAQKVPQPNFPKAHIHQGKRPIMQNGTRKQTRPVQQQRRFEPTQYKVMGRLLCMLKDMV